MGFNTQPPEGGCVSKTVADVVVDVSTHSRLKAAVDGLLGICPKITGFNTQPPEGGWEEDGVSDFGFQVSTHSRLKAAGSVRAQNIAVFKFQHTAA